MNATFLALLPSGSGEERNSRTICPIFGWAIACSGAPCKIFPAPLK